LTIDTSNINNLTHVHIFCWVLWVDDNYIHVSFDIRANKLPILRKVIWVGCLRIWPRTLAAVYGEKSVECHTSCLAALGTAGRL
jgi:hypothetical protein